ncbi:MAG: acyl-CoA dehydrogenase family protein [Acidobacteriota bacterium]
MDFSFTPEEKMIRTMVRDLADQVLRPGVSERERAGRFPEEAIPPLAEAGLLGMAIPEQFGGTHLNTVSFCLAIEELARVCASTAVTVSVSNTVCGYPISHFGTADQKQRYLPRLARGEMLGGFCLTEPGAGSDAAGISSRYRKQGSEFILDGTKTWVTNARVGSLFVVMATRNSQEGARGISAFLVESGFPGFSFGRLEDKLGLRASTTGEVRLEDCRVPASNLLGEEGKGLNIALHCLTIGRLGIAAQAIGIAEEAFQVARDYAKQRQAFGRAISSFQAIQFMLADMVTGIEASRWLMLRAACMRDAGNRDFGRESSMAKLFASETSKRVADAALQIHGGYGYSREYPVERLFRDARVTSIYEGTSEIQRIVIARSLLASTGS